MSRSLAKSPQGPHRSSRRPRVDSNSTSPTGNTSNSEIFRSTSTSTSDTAFTDLASTYGIKIKGHSSASRKKSQGSKKRNDGSEAGRRTSHTPTSSQSNLLTPDKNATPVRQAYAGSTFHSSPAASSLPMPSFYSKSLPDVSASPSSTSAAQLDGQGHAGSDTDTLIPDQPEEATPWSREPSPLDFMFEAARRARESSLTQSPDFRASRPSLFNDVSRNGSRTPGDGSSESVFPLELDSKGGRSRSIGPFFTTPYKDRVEALQPTKPKSLTPTPSMDEEERKEKTEALKRFLINASPLPSPHKPDMNSYFPASTGNVQPSGPYMQCGRPQSGPPTPQHEFPRVPLPHHRLHNMPAAAVDRPTSSRLRREYQPDNHQSPAVLDLFSATDPQGSAVPQNHHPPSPSECVGDLTGQSICSAANAAMGLKSCDSQKPEDDLR